MACCRWSWRSAARRGAWAAALWLGLVAAAAIAFVLLPELGEAAPAKPRLRDMEHKTLQRVRAAVGRGEAMGGVQPHQLLPPPAEGGVPERVYAPGAEADFADRKGGARTHGAEADRHNRALHVVASQIAALGERGPLLVVPMEGDARTVRSRGDLDARGERLG